MIDALAALGLDAGPAARLSPGCGSTWADGPESPQDRGHRGPPVEGPVDARLRPQRRRRPGALVRSHRPLWHRRSRRSPPCGPRASAAPIETVVDRPGHRGRRRPTWPPVGRSSDPRRGVAAPLTAGRPGSPFSRGLGPGEPVATDGELRRRRRARPPDAGPGAGPPPRPIGARPGCRGGWSIDTRKPSWMKVRAADRRDRVPPSCGRTARSLDLTTVLRGGWLAPTSTSAGTRAQPPSCCWGSGAPGPAASA